MKEGEVIEADDVLARERRLARFIDLLNAAEDLRRGHFVELQF